MAGGVCYGGHEQRGGLNMTVTQKSDNTFEIVFTSTESDELLQCCIALGSGTSKEEAIREIYETGLVWIE